MKWTKPAYDEQVLYISSALIDFDVADPGTSVLFGG